MKILITGAFGNVGKAVIEEVYNRGHKIIVFEIENKQTRKMARKYRKKISAIHFGDIRNIDDVKAAIQECDAVIHLAAIIPPLSKRNRELTFEVNYGGTVNLVQAINETSREIPLVFTSSASVMGPTQDQDKLVERNDPLVVTYNYEESKIKCEEFLREEADNYLIFRLAGVLIISSKMSLSPKSMSLFEETFDMHPDMRLEFVLDVDVATALVNAVEKLQAGTTQKNQAYILGGGKENGWQFIGAEFLSSLFESFSLEMPDRKYFTKDINSYHLDWYDTKEAQQEFDFQNHTFEDYLKHMKKSFRFIKPIIFLFRKAIMKRLVKMSPYYNDK
jgi:nucleoside-diphosphate-sugar epimerase